MEHLGERFGIKAIEKGPKTPLPQGILIPNQGEKATAKQINMYQQKVGSVNFPAVYTRPDISHSTSRLSEYLQNPTQQHIEAVNHLILYLICSKFLGLEFDGNHQYPVEAFMGSSDASFADDALTRWSSMGFTFSFFLGMVHWRALKIKTVATSSTHAELLALSVTAKDYIWWMRFLQAIGFEFSEYDQKPFIYCDNQQTLRLLQTDTPRLVTKLKHVDIQQCWLRQEVQNGNIKVKWASTNHMIADGLTKSLSPQRHALFINLLNMVLVPILQASNSDAN